jgi:hypothetical protein
VIQERLDMIYPWRSIRRIIYTGTVRRPRLIFRMVIMAALHARFMSGNEPPAHVTGHVASQP